MSHVTRQHPERTKRPDIGGERAANAYAGPVRIDLPGPGFTTSVFYNRKREPIDLTLTFTTEEATASDAIYLSDHVGDERKLSLGSHELTLAAPRQTFNAFGKNWAWVGGRDACGPLSERDHADVHPADPGNGDVPHNPRDRRRADGGNQLGRAARDWQIPTGGAITFGAVLDTLVVRALELVACARAYAARWRSGPVDRRVVRPIRRRHVVVVPG